MGWSLGYDGRFGKYGRDIGYGVPSVCDHPECAAEIHRGLAYVCGSHPHGGEHGCGMFFCHDHLRYVDRDDECPQLCACCEAHDEPFDPKPDTAEWRDWKLSDESWAKWREGNAAEVAEMRGLSSAKPVEREVSRDEPLIPPSTRDHDGIEGGL